MQTMVKTNVDKLRQRALQRHISFTNQKNDDDVQTENNYFDEMKDMMYRQIIEEEQWNQEN